LVKQMRRILITGSTGQIGSGLTLELRKRCGSHNVIATGHRRRPAGELASGPFEFLDLSREEEIAGMIREREIDTIFHLAAVLSVKGEEDPLVAWNVNMSTLVNVLEAARKERVAKVFWPSSIAVFGASSPHDNTPQETVLRPTTMYGVTKVSGELLCEYYFNKYGVDVRSVRYPGIISSEALPGGGTTDYAVAIFYEAIRTGRYTSFVRKDTVLPMMYMPDCIDATIKIMTAEPDRVRRHDAYNLAGMSFSAGELAEEISRHVPGFECSYEPDQRQKIADSWPNSVDDSSAVNDWGWRPTYDIHSMTADMIQKIRAKLSAPGKG
jgi:nucleoside-diphosphate-sugar epimerase